MPGPVNPKTAAFHERVRKLHGEGLSAYGIAKRLGINQTSVYRYLRNNGLVPPEQGQSLLVDYRPPHHYDSELAELTPLRRRELEQARDTAFRKRVDYEMTLKKASRYMHAPVEEVMEREKMTMEQARYVIEQAYNFLKRLRQARAEE